MGRGWKNLEKQARKILFCHEWSNKNDSGEDSEDEQSRKNLELLKDYLSGYDQNVDRDVEGKGILMRSQTKMRKSVVWILE